METRPTILGPSYTRRHVIQLGMLGLGAAAFGAGCGSSDNAATDAGSPATSSGPVKGGTITFAWGDFASGDSLDPVLAGTFSTVFNGGLIYDTVVRLNERWEPEPGLATEWEANADATEFTFTLRDDVTFHDGSPLTSADVVYSWRRFGDAFLGAPLKPFVRPADITADGAQVVRIKAKSSVPWIFALLGDFPFRVIKDGTDDFAKPVGTGAFKVEQWEPGSRFVVSRNDEYWEPDLPHLDGVEVSYITDQNTKVQSVLAGDFLCSDQVPYPVLRQVEGSADYEQSAIPRMIYVPIACNAAREPFKDERVRRAFKLLVDRDKLLEVGFGGAGELSADVPVTPGDPLYPSNVEPFPYDPAEAKRLLAEAGQEGLELDFFTTPLTPGMVDTAVLFAESAKEAGVTLNVKQVTADEFFEKVEVKETLYVSAWSRLPPQINVPTLLTSDAPYNESSFKSPEFDRLVTEAAAAVDVAESKQLYEQAFEILVDESGFIVPAHVDVVWAKSKRIKGLQHNFVDLGQLREAYLEA